MPEYMRNFLDCLSGLPGLETPDDFARLVSREARRLPPASVEDFLSLILVECLEELVKGTGVSKQQTREAVWRVRKRMAREILKQKHRSHPADIETLQSRETSPEARIALNEGVKHILTSLTIQETILLYLLMDGYSQHRIAPVLGCSEATVSRRIAAVRKKMTVLLDQDNS